PVPSLSPESVYDLLPKELQLPSSTECNTAAMSQKSGGEAGPPPPAALASVILAMMNKEAVCCSCRVSHLTFQSAPPCTPLPRSLSRPPCETAALRARGGGVGGGGAQQLQQQHQTTPSKRRTVLNISPPPEDLFDDSRMSCQDEGTPDSEQSSSIWMEDSASNFSIVSSSSYNDNTEVPRKSRKRTPRQRPGPKPVPADEASMDVFDADSAKGPHFVLSQLGSDSKACPKGNTAEHPQSPTLKGVPLSGQYPSKSEGKELKILVQPETQHRARYLTEGSRGSVKDRTQQGFPTVKLEGVNEPVILQVFVGNDTGRVKPHGFYQACRVTGRNTTACKEVDIEGTTVIEVCLDPSNSMTLAVDCVGILKLRNADVEARIGVAGSKKKSTRSRLVFRVNIPRPDGSILTLQTPSSPILCTQPAGVPEILKKSLHSCSVKGGEEVFLIGKNFLKGTKVIFQENASDENSWKAEAEIDMELFHQNHLIVKVPPYQNQLITSPVSAGIYVVTNAGRSHDVQPFTYTPEPAKAVEVAVKKEVPTPAKPCCFDEQMKVIQASSCTLDKANLLPSALMTPLLPLVKTEEVTPMEVSTTQTPAVVFKQTSDVIGSAQQTLDSMSSGNNPFSTSLSHQQGEPEQSQPAVFASREPLSTIQKQDIAPTSSFTVPSEPLFLLEPRESLPRERANSNAGSVLGLTQLSEGSAQQQGQLPSSLFTQDAGVAQLERAVRQLQAGGFSAAGSGGSSLVHPTPTADGIQPQVLENLSLQQQLPDLFHSQVQGTVQGSPQTMVQNPGSLFQPSESLLHSTSQQQQQQQQQQEALFQQAGELLSIQTPDFLQQPPSHPSPPQQLFHSPSPMAETQEVAGGLFQKVSPSQEQVQAAIFQNTLTVLTSSALSPEQQPSATSLFISQTALQGQLTTDPGSLFQNMSSSPASALSPNQQQQQQAGLLFQNSNIIPQEQKPSMLFSGQNQMPPLSSSLPSQEPQSATLFIAQSNIVAVSQQEPSEPMSFQNQNPVTGNPSQSESSQQSLFQGQQPMQIVQGSSSTSEQPVAIFMPQASISALQGSIGSQEISQTSIFTSQNTLQTTSSSPVQQPGSLFQTSVSGTISQPGQTQQPAGLFLFGIQNDCGQLIGSAGSTLSDQLIAISQSGQNSRDSEAEIQSLLNQSISESGSIQNTMTASQNMEKIDDLLVSLQDQSNNISRSF
uniref:Nuclear factor of activated T-cells 5 n=1 Tax=Lepisosteus oculatus TaxID=7918 RepID=W5M8Q2_LEPOC